MARWTNRPIDTWPGKLTPYRRSTPFSASWGATIELLDRELHHLVAKDVVLQRAFREVDLRLDGEPRSGARPEHPGVVLSFESRYGPLRFACDRFVGWEANLVAATPARGDRMTTHREHRNVNGSVRRHEHTCMKCRQRIRPWSNRWSIGRGLFVHPGCLIRASTNTITAREIALRALKVALSRRAG